MDKLESFPVHKPQMPSSPQYEFTAEELAEPRAPTIRQPGWELEPDIQFKPDRFLWAVGVAIVIVVIAAIAAIVLWALGR